MKQAPSPISHLYPQCIRWWDWAVEYVKILPTADVYFHFLIVSEQRVETAIILRMNLHSSKGGK